VYDIALETISHGDGRVDPESLSSFVAAYQTATVLTLGELWAIPIMLRLALIENLRRVGARIAADRIGRNRADYWADQMTEIAEKDPKKLVEIVAALAPTFGGINLEDIKAPECFYVEEELKKRLDIPVFHDDQHGTAIITTAALLNALEFAKKKAADVRVVISGAGAAGIASADMYTKVGVPRDHITFVDSIGVIHVGRKEGMNPYKEAYAQDTRARTLADALKGALEGALSGQPPAGRPGRGAGRSPWRAVP
jgi:hypothetical protein